MSKIPYYLLKNTQGAAPSYRAVTVPREAPFADFVADLVTRTGVKTEDVSKLLAAIGPVLGERTANGYSTDWPDFALFKPLLIDATVAAPDAQLPTTTRGDISVLARGAFKTALETAEGERIPAPATSPEWETVGAENGTLGALTDRTILKIVGKNLDYNSTRADEGVFLRSMAGNATSAALATRHTAQKIDALVPEGLGAGASYALELHTRGANGAASRELEVFVWPGTLTAA